MKIFNDKYAMLKLRKNVKIGPIYHSEEEKIYGLSRNNIIKKGKIIIFHDWMGNVIYKGSDYIYKPFSIYVFLRRMIFERIDRKYKGNNMNEIPREIAKFIPRVQLEVTEEHIKEYIDIIKRLGERISKMPKLGETDGLKEHPAILHYFAGGTDIYICEYDGKDTMFGYSILNNDLDNSEFGYISLSELVNISVLNLDYYFKDQSIEKALFKRNKEYFKRP
jgi:hypothetical protein